MDIQPQQESDIKEQRRGSQTSYVAASTGGQSAAPASGLGSDRIGKLLLEFSVPSVIAMLANSLYIIIDTMFLQAAVPSVGPAVTQLAFPVTCILMGFSMLAGIGGNALAAIELGKKHHSMVEKILANTALLLFVLALGACVVGTVCIDQLLTLLGTTDELWGPTKTFIQIVCFFFAFQSLGMGMNNFLRTASRPNLAFGCSFFGTAVCIGLNALFVLALGLGVTGSAYATVLGQMAGMIPVLWFFGFSPKAPFKFRVKNFAPDIKLIGNIIMLGLASFVMQAASALVTVVLNHVITLYASDDPLGVTNAIAYISIVWKVLALCYTVIIGITAGAQPILGFNVGARQWDRVLKTLKWACIASFLTAAVFWMLFETVPQIVLIPFSVDAAGMDFSCQTMRIFAFWLPFVGYQMMGSSYFQSSGQPIKATILELTRQFLFLIPLYLVFPPLAMQLLGTSGLIGVTLCVPLSDIIAFVVTTIFVILEVRRLKERKAQETPAACVS